MARKILIIEDEQHIVDILKFNLKKEGYETLEAYDGATGLELALTGEPNLILLDVMLPQMDGYEVCRKIREEHSQVPIIMLTAREEELDKVLGLELGADDYMTKPFSIRELTARVKANLRRVTAQQEPDPGQKGQPANIIQSGDLMINAERYEAVKNGKVIDITLREFELLKFLATQPDKIFSREKLLENVWGYE